MMGIATLCGAGESGLRSPLSTDPPTGGTRDFAEPARRPAAARKGGRRESVPQSSEMKEKIPNYILDKAWAIA